MLPSPSSTQAWTAKASRTRNQSSLLLSTAVTPRPPTIDEARLATGGRRGRLPTLDKPQPARRKVAECPRRVKSAVSAGGHGVAWGEKKSPPGYCHRRRLP